MSIEKIKEMFRELNGYFTAGGDFQKYFQSDFVIASMGLTKGKDRRGEITAVQADAFFIDSFFGKAVPAGFRKSLNLPQEVGVNNNAVINAPHKINESANISTGNSYSQASQANLAGSIYYDVILQSFGNEKIQTIKVIREVSGLGLKEAKDIVDNAPAPIVQGITLETARVIEQRLSSVGAAVRMSENRQWNQQGEREIRGLLKLF
jgi:ribosomal protein L7/L12